MAAIACNLKLNNQLCFYVCFWFVLAFVHQLLLQSELSLRVSLSRMCLSVGLSISPHVLPCK